MNKDYIPKYILDNDLSHLYISKSNIDCAGEGVFSKIYIPKNTIIEKANIIPIPKQNLETTKLMDYVFNNPDNLDEYFVAFGFASMYNHSDNPCAKYEYDEEENKIIFTSIKNIQPNEEIYIAYGNGWWDFRNDKIKI
jgi:SET domain-containing protein